MGLPWVRLDTQLPSNPKMLMLMDDENHAAISLYIFGLCYSGAHGTDGFIPRQALRVLGGTIAEAHELAEVRLWCPTEGGWDINDWTEYQPTTEMVDEKRARRKAAAKKAAQIRWSKHQGREESA